MSDKYSLNLIGGSGKIADTMSAMNGISWLNEKGFAVQNPNILNRSYLRFSGQDSERANDINRLAKAIHSKESTEKSFAMGIRGGYGLSSILHSIEWECLGNAVDNGLVLVGHSDFTALSIGLFSKTGKPSLAGPMISPDFSEKKISDFTWQSFLSIATNRKFHTSVEIPQIYLNQDLSLDECPLWGGNLTMLTSLVGTEYFPSEKNVEGGLLFIEDINEHPYRIERMILQLAYSGILNCQKALVLGDFSGYKLTDQDAGYDLGSVIRRIGQVFKDMNINLPILNGLPFGHIYDKITIPVGVKCSLIAGKRGFELKSQKSIF